MCTSLFLRPGSHHWPLCDEYTFIFSGGPHARNDGRHLFRSRHAVAHDSFRGLDESPFPETVTHPRRQRLTSNGSIVTAQQHAHPTDTSFGGSHDRVLTFSGPSVLVDEKVTCPNETKQPGSGSRAFRPRIWNPDRWRRQRPGPRDPSSLLRFQRIHPTGPVLPQNGDPLRRNAIYAGSPAVSATGIVRPR
jgi:hypothetical protein